MGTSDEVRKPRGTYFETTETRLREAMQHVTKPGNAPETRAYSLAATAVAPLLGCSTFEATRFLERARFLVDAGEILPDLLRRLNPPTIARRPFAED